MRVEDDEVIFRSLVRFSVLPDQPINKFKAADTTPSVSNCTRHLACGAVVTITNFTNGSDGQQILILGDGDTTIKNNTHIVTNTGADKLLVLNKVYRFSYWNSITKWIEDA